MRPLRNKKSFIPRIDPSSTKHRFNPRIFPLFNREGLFIQSISIPGGGGKGSLPPTSMTLQMKAKRPDNVEPIISPFKFNRRYIEPSTQHSASTKLTCIYIEEGFPGYIPDIYLIKAFHTGTSALTLYNAAQEGLRRVVEQEQGSEG